MTNDKFLPDGYEVPKTAGGNYFKLEDGPNKFRVLSAPVMGWEYWNTQDKPVRLHDLPKEQPEDLRQDMVDGSYKPSKIKHFWSMVVWSYKEAKLQILEITQATIQHAIADLALNDDWGNPMEYDLTITRKGEKLKTEYTVQPSPQKPVPVDAHKAYREARINLQALFTGGDPFAGGGDSEGDVVMTTKDEIPE